MIAARKRIGARNPHRDATMILLAYRHGLRASELCSLRWDMLDLSQGRYHVTRRKNGRPSVHLIRGTEIRDLRRLQREQVPQSIYVFTTERRGPMTPATFRKLLTTIGTAAELPFPVHPHMLRHACGYKLAHDGHDTRALQEWLGHSNIQNTTRYTELTSQEVQRFLAARGLRYMALLEEQKLVKLLLLSAIRRRSFGSIQRLTHRLPSSRGSVLPRREAESILRPYSRRP